MKKIVFVLFSMLALASNLFADNVYVNFKKLNNIIESDAIIKEFKQVEYLQLQEDIVINNNDDVTIEIDGATELNTVAIYTKVFADNFVTTLRTPQGVINKNLDALEFKGRYFKGEDNLGARNANINWYNMQVVIKYLKDEEEYFIEPLTNFDANADKNVYIKYSSANIKPTNKVCGTGHEMEVNKSAQSAKGGTPQGAGACLVMDRAYLLDYTYYVKYNGNLNNMINRIATINNLSEDDFKIVDGISDDLSFRIVDILIPTCDTCGPWPKEDTINNQLNNITNYPQDLFTNDYDHVTVVYVPSVNISSTIGLAWIGTICQTFPGALYASNVIQDYTTNLGNMRCLMSHELGHNFNANHDTIVNNCIMNPSVNGSIIWSAKSKLQINAEIGVISGVCLDPCPVIASACDTLVMSNFTITPSATKQVIKWTNKPGVTYMQYWLIDASTGFATQQPNIPTGVDSAVHTFNFTGCSKKYIMELTPFCGNVNFGATMQFVYVAKKTGSAPTVTITPTNPSACTGSAITFTSSVSGTGAPLPTYVWFKNGVAVGTNAPTFTSSNFSTGDIVTCVVTSNDACNTGVKDTSNAATFLIGAPVAPSVVIAASTNSVCSGSTITFTATPTNGGTAPSYQWKVNGANTGVNSATLITSSLNNGDVVSCIITSNAPCAQPSTASSNNITMFIQPSVTPGISISTNSTTVCPGANTIFAASTSNAGNNPLYTWFKNGVQVGNNNSVYQAVIANGDVIVCSLNVAVACASVLVVSSNTITMSVQSNVQPSITIAASNNPICNGGTVTFTASPVNGGALPVYQWHVNGGLAGTGTATFVSNSLSNGAQVYVTLTSNSPCVSIPTANSNTVTISVIAPLTPLVNITGTTSFCPGSTVSFNATPSQGGPTPSYQWFLNNNPVGSNTSTYTNNAVLGGSTIYVVMTSSSTSCLSTTTAKSNVVTLVQSPSVTPTVTISVNNASICQGSTVTIAASSSNGGNAPSYAWKVNGNPIGTNSATLITNAITNGDVISVIMTSNSNACLTSPTATSNSITFTVNPLVTPSVTIAANTNPICQGAPLILTATVTNGGSNPTYQWRRGNNNAGPNNAVYTPTIFTTGTTFSLYVTSNASCLANPKDTSNSIVMTVLPSVIPLVAITAIDSSLCAGDVFNFSSTTLNGGSAPLYEWQVNGVPVSGATTTTFTSNALLNNDNVTLVVTSNESCAIPPTDTSAPIQVKASPIVTPTASLTVSDDDICIGDSVKFTVTTTGGGNNPTYKWYWNGVNIANNTNTFISPLMEDADSVYVIITSNAECIYTNTATSNAVKMKVSDNVTAAISLTPSNYLATTGSAITYFAAINIPPNYSIQWYRNGGLTVTTSIPSWSTTVISNTDSVYARLVGFLGCYTNITALSNGVQLGRYPEGVANQNNINFSIYPNPVTTVANIEGLKVDDEILLYDVTGKLILNTRVFYQGAFKLDMSNLAAGVYQAKFIRDSQNYLMRIIKSN